MVSSVVLDHECMIYRLPLKDVVDRLISKWYIGLVGKLIEWTGAAGGD